jgi:hypothetical protein
MRSLIGVLALVAATAPIADHPAESSAKTTGPELPRVYSNLRQMRLASPHHDRSKPGRNYLSRHGEGPPKDKRPATPRQQRRALRLLQSQGKLTTESGSDAP